MKTLTKEDILKGKDKRVTLYLKEYGKNIVIRPLTDGELTEILAKLGGIKFKPDGTPDFEKMDLSKNFELLRIIASKGLVKPKLSPKDLGEMKFGVPEYIGLKVLEISGLVPPEEEEKKS